MMASQDPRRERSLSLPAVIAVPRQQRVNPELDPEDGRGRRKSRRPSMRDALVPRASISAAPNAKSPEHAWEALCQKSKQLPKPDLEANPPLTIEDIRCAALTEWVAALELGREDAKMTQFQIELFNHVLGALKVRCV